MDGLYPSGPVFQLCQRNRWDYMIILKDDSLKTVWEDAEGLRKLDKEGNLRKSHRWGDRDQSFWRPRTGPRPSGAIRAREDFAGRVTIVVPGSSRAASDGFRAYPRGWARIPGPS